MRLLDIFLKEQHCVAKMINQGIDGVDCTKLDSGGGDNMPLKKLKPNYKKATDQGLFCEFRVADYSR
jgi:hypothetical protein